MFKVSECTMSETDHKIKGTISHLILCVFIVHGKGMLKTKLIRIVIIQLSWKWIYRIMKENMLLHFLPSKLPFLLDNSWRYPCISSRVYQTLLRFPKILKHVAKDKSLGILRLNSKYIQCFNLHINPVYLQKWYWITYVCGCVSFEFYIVYFFWVLIVGINRQLQSLNI